jgi:hypothetical protein
MPLVEETWTVNEGLDQLEERIAELQAEREDLVDGTPDDQAVEQQIAQAARLQTGLVAAVEHASLDPDAEFTIGLPTAGEEYRVEREMSEDTAAAERGAWFVAAGTVEAPWQGEDVAATFRALASDYPRAFVDWLENRINALSLEGNAEWRSSRASSESETASDSTAASTEPDSS